MLCVMDNLYKQVPTRGHLRTKVIASFIKSWSSNTFKNAECSMQLVIWAVTCAFLSRALVITCPLQSTQCCGIVITCDRRHKVVRMLCTQALIQRICQGNPQAWWMALRTTMMTMAVTAASPASLPAPLKPAAASRLPDFHSTSTRSCHSHILTSELWLKSSVCHLMFC